MRLSIRMKIFLPVMIILIACPLAVWLVLRYSLDSHMNYNARRSLEWAMDRAEELHAHEEEFFATLVEEISADNVDTRMMAVSDGYRVLHPLSFEDQPEMTELYPMFLTKVTGGEAWQSGSISEEMIGGEKYLLYYRAFESAEPSADGADDGGGHDAAGETMPEVAYLVLYQPIHDTAGILGQVSIYIFMIMAATAAVSIVLLWFVAGSISGPVIRLTEAAHGIGDKVFRRVETGTTVRELCQLEDEINQMQVKLQQADQAERTFFQNASHELRTPLMSISGYAQGIQCGVFEDTASAAGIILDESTRLTEVVDGILTLTRMDQQRYQVVPVEMDVSRFVEERLELLEGFAYSQKKKLVYTPDEEHMITVDAMLLERAFSNVVSNCIRYAAEAVTIHVEKAAEGVQITVADDGPGIRPEETETIFDRFHKGKDGNHGLGLAIARRSLEYMGGSVRAVSASNGAVFILQLPFECHNRF